MPFIQKISDSFSTYKIFFCSCLILFFNVKRVYSIYDYLIYPKTQKTVLRIVVTVLRTTGTWVRHQTMDHLPLRARHLPPCTINTRAPVLTAWKSAMNGVLPTTVSGLVQMPSVTLDQWQRTTPQKETPAVVRWTAKVRSQTVAFYRQPTPRVLVLHHRLGVDIWRTTVISVHRQVATRVQEPILFYLWD